MLFPLKMYFYDSREMKELALLEMLKIYGSRMTGALLTRIPTFAVFNGWMLFRSLTRKFEQPGKNHAAKYPLYAEFVSHTP